MELKEKLSKMIQVSTVSKENINIEFNDFINLLKELYPNLFRVAEYRNYNGCFVLIWRGKNNNNPILFMNHHDVVEANNVWEFLPFSGTITDDKVWGRGALDTKGGLSSMLEAADELITNGFIPNNDIYFLSDNCEETTGVNAEYAANELYNEGIRFKYILDEGGYIMDEPISGAKGTHAMIGLGEKGCADIRFIAKSNGGHASTPPKNTPWIRLSKFMLDVERKNLFISELTPVLMEMFRSLSKSMSGFTKLLLSHPKFFKPLIKAIVPRLSPTTNAFFRTTICFTVSESGKQKNSIPDEVSVNGNMRFSIHEGRDASINELKKIANKYDIEIVVDDPGIESSLSDFNDKSYKNLANTIEKLYPGVIPTPYVMTGASDARYFSKLSNNIYRFIPFKINEQQLESIHGLNENVDIVELNKSVDFYKYLMEQ